MRCDYRTIFTILGHHVSNGCTSIPERRAEVFRTYSKPVTKRGLRAFLGAVSFYRRYVKRLASETVTLSPATAKAAPVKVEWTKEMETAFNTIRELVANQCSLTITLPEHCH